MHDTLVRQINLTLFRDKSRFGPHFATIGGKNSSADRRSESCEARNTGSISRVLTGTSHESQTCWIRTNSGRITLS